MGNAVVLMVNMMTATMTVSNALFIVKNAFCKAIIVCLATPMIKGN